MAYFGDASHSAAPLTNARVANGLASPSRGLLRTNSAVTQEL
jgi:hypothetical protein